MEENIIVQNQCIIQLFDDSLLLLNGGTCLAFSVDGDGVYPIGATTKYLINKTSGPA